MTLEQLLHEKRDAIRRIATAHGASNSLMIVTRQSQVIAGGDVGDSNKTELANPPPWLKLARGDVARMAALPANWDSYGSPPPSDTVRQNAVQLLDSIEYEDFPAPRIVSLSGGWLQIEWQYNKCELE